MRIWSWWRWGRARPSTRRCFRELAQRFPAKLGVKIGYDNTLAHKIEAGADMFLMPSRYEPCGLNQIYSLRYGTVPVVRATGGLDDTIEPFDRAPAGRGTGFKFEEYTGGALLGAVRQALAVFGKGGCGGVCKPTAWPRISPGGLPRPSMLDCTSRPERHESGRGGSSN